MLIRIADLLTRRAEWAILLVALVAGISAALAGWAAPVNTGVEAVRQSLFSKPASGETVVVAIDGQSLSEIQNWPWPRSIHGRLVDRLREAGADRIAFDIAFLDPAGDPAQDRAFAAAIGRARGSVVLPAVLENHDGVMGERVEELPAPMLRRDAEVGAIWIRLDDDLVVRNVPYSVNIAGARRPSLSTILAGRATDRAGSFPLDWSIDPFSFPTVSYADVLAGRFDRRLFEGRNVVVGSTSNMLGDQWVVPYWGRIPGVYIHAVGSETLRRHVPVPVGSGPRSFSSAS